MRLRTATALLAVFALIVLGVLLASVRWLVPAPGGLPVPRPAEACSVPDPSSARGCLTPTAKQLYDRAVERFGAPASGAPVRSVTCWGDRAANAESDHPAGRACDFFPTRAGTFPEGAERDAGWAVAQWARDNARDLDVRYVIWQGRIWYRGSGDTDGWGSPYDGGGAYDPRDATGGHFDHVHISVGS